MAFVQNSLNGINGKSDNISKLSKCYICSFYYGKIEIHIKTKH